MAPLTPSPPSLPVARQAPPPAGRGRLLAALVALAAGAIDLLRVDGIHGLMGDDGWYMVLGKALAEGHGYRLVSSAAAEILPMYPPGFPAALALPFRLDPAFPGNVWLLKSVSGIALCAIAVLTYRYLRDVRRLAQGAAACAAAAVALTPGFVFLATSTVMSECLFTAAQLASVLLVERAVVAPSDTARRRYVVGAAAATALTVLTRTAGIALMLVVPVYCVMRRCRQAALLYVGVGILCLFPWWMYSQRHQPSPEERAAQGGQIALPYSGHFWRNADGTGSITVGNLPARVLANAWEMVSRDAGGLFIPVVYRGPGESGQEVIDLAPPTGQRPRSMGNASGTVWISCLLAALTLTGFVSAIRQGVTVAEYLVPVSVGMTALWPFAPFRFLLPLAPFFVLYLIKGVELMAPAPAVRTVLFVMLGLHVYDHAGYIAASRGVIGSGPVYFQREFDDVERVMEWMRDNLHAEGAVATDRPALVYLHTGRKTVAIDRADDNWARWKALGVRYVVALTPGALPDRSHVYRVLFQLPSGRWVVEM